MSSGRWRGRCSVLWVLWVRMQLDVKDVAESRQINNFLGRSRPPFSELAHAQMSLIWPHFRQFAPTTRSQPTGALSANSEKMRIS